MKYIITALVLASVIVIIRLSMGTYEVTASSHVARLSERPTVGVPSADSLRVPILMYHHVGSMPPKPDAIRRDLTVSPSDFEQQVKWLHDNHYQSISLEQVYLATQGKFTLPKQPVVFTFDDGYDDDFTVAEPILRKNGFIGSFAIVPDFVGTPGYTTWDAIRAGQKDGMEMVSHTMNHFDGTSPKYDAKYITQNLTDARAKLEKELGTKTNILIYPYGHSTPEYRKIAQQVGYVMGLTTHFGTHVNPHDLMLTPRVRAHGDETLTVFEHAISSSK